MGRSDSERAPVLSAMLPSVSACRSVAAARRPNVAHLTSPMAYAVSPAHHESWPFDGWGSRFVAFRRLGVPVCGLSTVAGSRFAAFRRLGGGGPGAGDLGLALGPLTLE